ncbi:MAG: aldehyde dehydrogenase EutE [Deltaproteobacteria bacterium RIFCSPHIGHO2_12_FULL_43_9]|nr:MAG: aldehyde dehydrogenase EutE [Deltaproteobacteria bacterium RIFCSPHIGHO2_12_FULL_43_9]
MRPYTENNNLSEKDVSRLVEKVLSQLKKDELKQPCAGAPAPEKWITPTIITNRGIGIFDDLDQAVGAASVAFEHWQNVPLENRRKIIAAIRKACHAIVDEISSLAVEETGLGRVEDKKSKNRLVIDKTPGVEILVPEAFTGDDGLMLMELAPFGVIGAITPCTNPSETIINNAIGMLAAGNSVVFNPHPSAKRVSQKTLVTINEAIVASGGPANMLTTVAEPTIDVATALMKHPGIRILVVTGGPGVVQAAMGSGKKVIAAGPGNPPVVVDETANLCQAGRDVVLGAGLDNNIVCVVEKELFVVDSVADKLKTEMIKNGAFEIPAHQIRRLTNLVLEDGHPKKECVGKNASVIARMAGINVPDETRLLILEVDENHPLVHTEMLMPVFPVVRVKDVGDGIREAVRAEGGRFHTAVMHSKNIDNLHAMARAVNTSIFVKNAPSYAGLSLGGEGYTSFTIASPTGEGLTTARSFSRLRRCTLKDHFRIV